MTRARRNSSEQHDLSIERAGVIARRFHYLSRLKDAIRARAKNRQWMWFYLILQAELEQQEGEG
jgi:hypothetical protein